MVPSQTGVSGIAQLTLAEFLLPLIELAKIAPALVDVNTVHFHDNLTALVASDSDVILAFAGGESYVLDNTLTDADVNSPEIIKNTGGNFYKLREDTSKIRHNLNDFSEFPTALISPLVSRLPVNGVLYSRVDSDPEHMYSAQDSEGQWWEFDNPYVVSNMAHEPSIVAAIYQKIERVYSGVDTEFRKADTVNVLAALAYKKQIPYTHVEAFDVRVRFDPVAEAFAIDGTDESLPFGQITDEDYFTANVPVAFNTLTNRTAYVKPRQQHNALERTLRWGNATNSLFEGNTIMFYETADFRDETVALEDKAYEAIELFGRHRIGDGNGQKLFLESAVVTNTVTDVSFSKLVNDPRNNTGEDAIYRATVTYGSPWHPQMTVGKAVVNRGISGATRADDGVCVINGAYEVLTMSPDRQSLTFDVWNPRESTAGADPQPLPDVGVLGTVQSGGISPNTALCQNMNIAPIGGWDGKGFEGYLSFERGARFRLQGIAFVDHTITANNELWDSANPTGYTGDRKLLFMGHDCHGVLAANNAFAGGEGSAIRTYGGNTLYSIHTIMGGTARDHLSRVGYRFQQNTSGQLVRCTTAGFTSRAVELGNSCTLSVHACGFFGNHYGCYCILTSFISTNSALFMWHNRALYTQSTAEVTIGTRFYSNQWALSWDGGEVRGTPSFDGNTFDTLGDVGPGEYYRGGWWRSVPSMEPPSPKIFLTGGRITGRVLALTEANSITFTDTGPGTPYAFTFISEPAVQDYNVLITPRDEAVKNWKFEYVGNTGFTVHLYDVNGVLIDADFSFNVAETRSI